MHRRHVEDARLHLGRSDQPSLSLLHDGPRPTGITTLPVRGARALRLRAGQQPKEVHMGMLVLTLTGFAGAMGIPVFLTAAAERAARAFKGTVPARAKAVATRRHES